MHNANDVSTTKSNAVYGVYTTCPAPVGSENIIKNNVIYNLNNFGGAAYGLYNNNFTFNAIRLGSYSRNR
jgi:hypothetical protein